MSLLAVAYQSLSDYQKGIEDHGKDLKIAIEIGDRAGEGRAYGNYGNAYLSERNDRKHIEYLKKYLKIARKSLMEPEKEEPMEILVMRTTHWVVFKKPLNIKNNI